MPKQSPSPTHAIQTPESSEPPRIAESKPAGIDDTKLSRVEMIAREALDILGDDAPDDLRRSVAEEQSRHEAEIHDLEDKLDGAAKQIKALGLDIKSAQRLAEDRLNEAEEVWELASRQASDLLLSNERISELENEAGLLRVTADSRAREIEAALAEAKTSADALEASLAETQTLREELNEKADEHDELQSQLESARKTIASLEDTVASLRADAASQTAEFERRLADAERRIEELTDESEDRAGRIEELTGDLQHARQQVADRSASLYDAEERLQAARESQASLQTELDQAIALAEESDEHRQEALQQAARARTELGKIRTEIAELSSKLADRDRVIAELSTDAPAPEDASVLGPAVPSPAKQALGPTSEPEPKPEPEPEPEPEASDAESVPRAKDMGAPAGSTALLQTELDARNTELSFLREQLDRADERANRYKHKAERGAASLEKARALVRRARRRSVKRTELYAGTVDAMTKLRIRCTELTAERDQLAELAKVRLIWAIAAGGLAVLGILSAAAF